MSLKERTPIRQQLLRPNLQFEEPSSIQLSGNPIDQALEVTTQTTMPMSMVAKATRPQKTSRQENSLLQQSGGPGIKNKQKTRKKRLPLWLAVCSVITIIAVVFVSQGNGTTGAELADTLRAIVGPTITAQVESWYLGLSNTSSQVQY